MAEHRKGSLSFENEKILQSVSTEHPNPNDDNVPALGFERTRLGYESGNGH